MQLLEKLVTNLNKLPGIGPKSATRLALHLLKTPPSYLKDLAQQLEILQETIHPCRLCRNYTDEDLCPICCDPQRDQYTLCVLESVQSLIALEKSREFKGIYFVLHGCLDPSEGVRPQHLHIPQLVQRIQTGHFQEVILATNSSLEGDITSSYIAKEISHMTKITRLAAGIPVGGDLEYTDQLTLAKALSHRLEFH